jgi:DNA polymerase (family 10)
MHNYEIAEYFTLLSKLMDIHGENPFKVKSYASAAFTLDKLAEPVTAMEPPQLFSIRGIGEAIGKKIIAIIETGHLDLLDEYIQNTPPGILEMIKIKGLGPKKITTIWKELEIETVGELLYACHENRLINYKGFGEKTQQNIQEALEFYLNHQGNYLFQQVEPIVASLALAVKNQFPQDQFIVSGAFVRQMETLDFLEVITTLALSDLQVWLESKGFKCVLNKLESPIEGYTMPSENYISSKGEDNFEIRWHHAAQNQIQWKHFTLSCSTEFLEAVIQLPSFNNEAVLITHFEDEAAIFNFLNLGFIPAPQRETAAILQKASNKATLAPTIQASDIKGIIHSHSTWSDGIHSIEQMALAAKAQGYEYLVISDHSKSAFYANGLQVDRIRAQHLEIDALNKKLAPFVIFKSIESDILNDGSLDYPDEVLETFDLVIASVHSNLKMTPEKAMMRLLTAVQNPYTSILGHATGRLLLSRKGYPVNHEELIEACAANDVVIELNAHPRRLDIDWRYIDEAITKDVLISINTDAHEIDGFADCKYGVLVAQKAGLRAAQNLSSFSLAEMMEFIEVQQEKRR